MTYAPYNGFGPRAFNSNSGDPIARLKQLIGFSEEPIQDSQGYWTTGYGERLNDKPGGPKPYATISEPIADEALRYRFAQDPGQFNSVIATETYQEPFNDNISSVLFGDNDGSRSSDQEPPKQKPNGDSWLDYFLAGRSKEELQKLKYGLERTSLGTAAFGVVIGEVLFLIDPSKVSVAVVIGGTALMTIGLQYLSSLVDEYMNKS